MDSLVKVYLTSDQVEMLAKHYNKDPEKLQEYEVGELVDLLIDNITVFDKIMRERT